jgi:hypothetical protein
MVSEIWPEETLSTALGVIVCCNGMGMLLGPVAGGFLYESFGFQLPFFIGGGIVLLDVLVRVVLVSEDALLELRQEKEYEANLNLARRITRTNSMLQEDAASLQKEKDDKETSKSIDVENPKTAVSAEGVLAQVGAIEPPQMSIRRRQAIFKSKDHDSSFAGAAGPGLAGVIAQIQRHKTMTETDVSLTTLMLDKNILLLCWCSFAVTVCFAGLEPILALHMEV